MKGAMAVPFVRTIRPPKIAIMMRIGNIQYFLRTRRNAKNSRINDIASSELIFHGFRIWARRLPRDPVGCRQRMKLTIQQILFAQTHKHAHRRHNTKIDQAERQWADDLEKDEPE